MAEMAGSTGRSTSLFLRKSSGLVRAFSTFDGFIYAVYADSIIAAAALTYAVGFPFSGANIPLGIIIICLALIPAFTVYAMLTTLMPRAGGDYVWQSRILGGFWGYVFTFTPLLVGPWFYMASNVSPGATLAVAPFFVVLDKITGIGAFSDFASWLVTPAGQFVFYILYCTFALVVLIVGMRLYARLQRWSFYIGVVGLLTWVLILLVTTQTDFIANFNRFMVDQFGYGDGQAYQKVIETAKANGYQPVALSQTNLGDSILIGPVLAYTFLFVAWTGTLTGEIGGVQSFQRSLRMFLGSNLFAMVATVVLMFLLIDRIGNEFFTSANYLWITGGTSELPITPFYALFLVTMVSNPLLWLWIVLAFNAWFWMWPTNNYVASTRVMFAMSFDRMLPAKLAQVSERFHTPIFAIAVCYVGSLFFGYLYFFTAFSKLTLDLPLFATFAFGASCLAGMLLPYMAGTKRIYWDSPLSKYTVAGLPLITVAGAASLVYFAFLLFEYLTDDRYGVNSPLGLGFIGVMVVISLAFYVGFRWLRRREGIDTSLTYREIPAD